MPCCHKSGRVHHRQNERAGDEAGAPGPAGLPASRFRTRLPAPQAPAPIPPPSALPDCDDSEGLQAAADAAADAARTDGLLDELERSRGAAAHLLAEADGCDRRLLAADEKAATAMKALRLLADRGDRRRSEAVAAARGAPAAAAGGLAADAAPSAPPGTGAAPPRIKVCANACL